LISVVPDRSASAGELQAAFGRLLGLGAAFQIEQAGQALEVLFSPLLLVRLARRGGIFGPDSDRAVAQLLALEGFGQTRLPTWGNFDHGPAAVQLDPAHAAAIETAERIEKREQIGLGDPSGDRFQVEQGHGAWRRP
jgi:hypothetical protein